MSAPPEMEKQCSIWKAFDGEAVFSDKVCLINGLPPGSFGQSSWQGSDGDQERARNAEKCLGDQGPPLHNCPASVGTGLANTDPHRDGEEGRGAFL